MKQRMYIWTSEIKLHKRKAWFLGKTALQNSEVAIFEKQKLYSSIFFINLLNNTK